MSRKKDLGNVFDILSQQSQPPERKNPSLLEIDSELYGALGKIDMHRMNAAPVEIKDIFPDPAQPRRAIPHIVRQGWDGDTRKLRNVFERWAALVEQERGTPFDILRYLDAQDDLDRREGMGGLEETLTSLIELAVSIRIEGLTNPITVAPMGLKYRLETGERRWLAYHLLFIYTADDRYCRISARTVDKISIWRQAAENNARANLNAISRARQFSILLMDLLQEHGREFKAMDAFTHEQAFYAQVADGTNPDLRTPRGSGDRLLAATGLKNKNQISNYRRLLELPSPIWQIADDLNWTEYFVREMREEAKSEKEFVKRALDVARASGYTSPTDDLAKFDMPPQPKSLNHLDTMEPIYAPGTRQHYTQLVRSLKRAGAGKTQINREALSLIQEIRYWLEEQERRLKSFEQ
jgi:hypothetical protein